MNISIIGAGNMARGIGTRLVAGGHAVTVVGSDPVKATKLRQGSARRPQRARKRRSRPPPTALANDVIVLALPFAAARDFAAANAATLAGKMVVDITNPLNDTYDGLVTAPGKSAAEEIADLLPKSRVVKAFNTTFAGTLVVGAVSGHTLDVLDRRRRRRRQEAGRRPGRGRRAARPSTPASWSARASSRASRLLGITLQGDARHRLPERLEARRLTVDRGPRGAVLAAAPRTTYIARRRSRATERSHVRDQALLRDRCRAAWRDRSIPGVRIGHVHLKVADIERSLAFYCGVLGFELMARYGTQAAFFSAGGYHHHFGINTWESKGGPPPPRGTTGLYHTAILYPTRAALADALRRLIAAGVPLDGASDHGVSEALYLRDPDENGVELYLGPPARGVAAQPGWFTGDEDRVAESRGLAARAAARLRQNASADRDLFQGCCRRGAFWSRSVRNPVRGRLNGAHASLACRLNRRGSHGQA